MYFTRQGVTYGQLSLTAGSFKEQPVIKKVKVLVKSKTLVKELLSLYHLIMVEIMVLNLTIKLLTFVFDTRVVLNVYINC